MKNNDKMSFKEFAGLVEKESEKLRNCLQDCPFVIAMASLGTVFFEGFEEWLELDRKDAITGVEHFKLRLEELLKEKNQ